MTVILGGKPRAHDPKGFAFSTRKRAPSNAGAGSRDRDGL